MKDDLRQLLPSSRSLAVAVLLTVAVVFPLAFFYPPKNLLRLTVERGAAAGKPGSSVEEVLGRAAMANKTVIVTTLNDAWGRPGSVLDVFLESFRAGEGTEGLLKHLVIVAMDEGAYNRCLAVHPHCLAVRTKGVDFSGQKNFMSDGYLKMMWRRIKFLQTILKKGYSFIFTDSDIVWFRDPSPRFFAGVDFQIACDRFNGNARDRRNAPNGGFTYVRSNRRTIQFYKFWYNARLNYTGKHDQDVLNEIKYHPFLDKIGLSIRFLDTVYFGGLCEPSKDLDKVCTMHTNCCMGLQRKVDDMRVMLDDWRRYRALPASEDGRRIGSWNVPKNCSFDPLR